MAADPPTLPGHDELGGLTRLIEIVSIVAAVVLLLIHFMRLASAPGLLSWRTLPVIFAGMVSADLVSGVVHWTADTWGNETLPIFGRRFLRPFRVHHINPNDFLRRDWIDTNGDVAMIVAALLIGLLCIPLDRSWGLFTAIFAVTFCACGLPTNQVHQWAHVPRPPAPVGWLQRHRLLLSHEQHALHHEAPYVTNYCIATGWCNRPLVAMRFFPALERVITRLTGSIPRHDEQSFQFELRSPEKGS